MIKILNHAGCGFDRRINYRYAIYEHKLTTADNLLYSRSFVVLKNQYGVIVYFSSFHNYVGVYENSVCRPLASDAKAKMLYLCSMLNYVLIDNHKRFNIDHVFGVSKEALGCFFRDYAQEKLTNGSYRSRQSIEKCVSAVITFFRKLSLKYGGYMSLTKEQLYSEKTVFTKQGTIRKKLIPDFQVCIMPSNKTIFRDIPTKIFQIILNLAFRYTPDIAFAICLQAFAGLRPGEVCNVRQEGCPLGDGIVLTIIDGAVKKAEVDLTAEYALRSDGVSCGRIKKERQQRIYPAFLPAFCKVYECHKEYLRTKSFEKDYCPMFVNSNGMAMTYANYRSKFKYLVNDFVRPQLLKHTDPECRLYGQLLCEHSLSPHALRHWFSVQLVLMGEDIAQIQYWRGDANPESALGYLQNKGDLLKDLEAANNLLADFMTEEGAKRYGKSDNNRM